MLEVKHMYQRIRDLREDRDLTQKNMGEILNCSQRIYSNYECGDVDIPTHILIALHGISAQAFNSFPYIPVA